MKSGMYIIVQGLFILFSLNSFTQNSDLELGVNELKYGHTKNYIAPNSIKFVFVGNPSYAEYYYTNLEKNLINKFEDTEIKIKFEYQNDSLEKNIGHKKTSTLENEKAIFYLQISNPETIDEKSGSNRIVTFNLNGKLISKTDFKQLYMFDSVVLVIHDINNQNEKVAQYLKEKILNTLYTP